MFRLLLLFLFLFQPDVAEPMTLNANATKRDFAGPSHFRNANVFRLESIGSDAFSTVHHRIKVADALRLDGLFQSGDAPNIRPTKSAERRKTPLARSVTIDFRTRRNRINTHSVHSFSTPSVTQNAPLVEVMLPTSFVPMMIGLVMLAFKAGILYRRPRNIYRRACLTPRRATL